MRRLATIVAIVLVSACVPRAPADEADPEGTLTTRIPGEPSLDPYTTTGFVEDLSGIGMVFEPLLRFDPKTLRPVPGAASALPDISPDGLTYRLMLRDDSRYSDGAPVRAKDFVYGFTRLCDPALKSPLAFVADVVIGCQEWRQLDPAKDPPERLRDAKSKLIGTGVVATAEREITIRLNQQAAYFPSVLGLWVLAPIRELDVVHGGAQWTEPATYIGNGPFVLTAWRHNEQLVFAPNPHYRNPPRLKRWTKLIIKDPASALDAYRQGQIDELGIGGQIGVASLIGQVDADPALRGEVVRATNLATSSVYFNEYRPPFDDPMVRLAFAKSIDRDAYVREVLHGVGVPALSFIPPGMPGHDPGDAVQRFDVAEARRLLEASRYADSDVLRSIRWTFNRENTVGEAQFRSLVAQWKANLGVDVLLDPVDPVTLGQLRRRPETSPQIGTFGWGADYPDQQDFLSLLFHSRSRNATALGFVDREFDRLIDQADRELDQTRRDQLYVTASRILSERAPLAFLNYGQPVWLRKPWLRGVIDSPLDLMLGSTAGVERIYVAKHSR